MKPGANKAKYVNSLYGYIVFGVTTDVEDFVLAMKEWAASNRHEVNRHGVPSASVIAGCLTHGSLTINRDICIAAIKQMPEWKAAGEPEFSMKVATLWSSGGADAKVPAIFLECDRFKVKEFIQMCETLFIGENLALPTALQGVYFFPSRSFSSTSPMRLTYIAEQRDFLASDRTVTCEGIGDIYQYVRVRTQPSVLASVENILMLLKGVRGPLFRSMDKTVDGKVFLKLDVVNIGAWGVCKDKIAEHLRMSVHPDDHALVFSEDTQDLNFSEPWMKFKDGQLARNVIDLPSKASVDYANRCHAKFANQTPQGIKKRAHSNVSESTTTTATSDSTISTNGRVSIAAIDLTSADQNSAASPNHKVHVVEQRLFQATNSPVMSVAGTISPMTSATSPRTARMQQLESKVQAHDTKLNNIQASVSNIEDKIEKGHEATNFQFGKLEEMLAHIHGEIVAGVQSAKKEGDGPSVPENVPMHDSEHEVSFAAYDPNARTHDWNETWRRDKAQRSFIESRRVEYVDELCKEAEQQGQCYDYYAAARERFPSPPPIEYPDDITYYDEL